MCEYCSDRQNVLNERIAIELFGLPPALVENYEFPLPCYSRDPVIASRVLGKIHDLALGDAFDDALLAQEGGWLRNAPLHMQLIAILPYMICEAALAAVQKKETK